MKEKGDQKAAEEAEAEERAAKAAAKGGKGKKPKAAKESKSDQMKRENTERMERELVKSGMIQKHVPLLWPWSLARPPQVTADDLAATAPSATPQMSSSSTTLPRLPRARTTSPPCSRSSPRRRTASFVSFS